ncbi:uncharacterized protein UV8b_08199 [Ustilaginoidea virens]|uniref:Cytochrome b561 domain-containing protein n=1 Tax=Ustilaginoidea virens TaxID=1159556 RepID=A0A8E5MKR9_USTVR|nr:uncharacterized protein UV8b_08199 [Ustilaginoidea virens]QUC23958.1 hypothetical protein UV8b_08199 [Ustilaginoidea virens]
MASSDDQTEPLLASQPAAARQNSHMEPLLGKPGDAVLPQGASVMRGFFIGTGILAQLGSVLLCINIWAHIFLRPVILFSGHPLAMSIGIFSLVQAILSLQPTVTPAQKCLGQRIHASLNIFALVSFLAGVVFIQVNKSLYNLPHFHSAHSVLGGLTLLVMMAQYIVGFTMLFTPRLYGSVDRAKRLYIYHRYAGYLILVLLLTTVCMAMLTDYNLHVLNINVWGVMLANLVILAGVISRIQKHKMGYGA